MNLKIEDLLDLDHTRAKKFLLGYDYPWEALPHIKEFILALGEELGDDFVRTAPDVWISREAHVAPTASISGPCIIDAGTEVRHCAFIRGSALVGRDCVVGNSTELKNVILFDHVQVPHYNYVGDSILGYFSHMGAGSITSNVKSDRSLVVIKDGDDRIETGLKKMGAILGDHVEVGCGSVLNPGSVIGTGTNVYPLSSVRGCVAPGSIYKNQTDIVKKV